MKKPVFAFVSAAVCACAFAGVGTMSTAPLWNLADHGGRRLVASTNALVVPHSFIQNQLAFTVEGTFTFGDVPDVHEFTFFDNSLGDTGWALRGYKRSGAGNPVLFVCNGSEYACSYGMGSVDANSTHTFTVTARDGWMVVYMDGKVQRSYEMKPIVNVADLTIGAPLAPGWKELPDVWLESLKVWGEDEKFYASGEAATPATGYVGGKGWLCEVPVAPNANATNVLLVGDSISDGYTPCFKSVAGKKANVWHWTASFSTPGAAGVPTNKINEVCALTNLDAIVFNNGLHSLNWTEAYCTDAQVKESYAALVDCFRAAAPNARVLYLSTTPYTAVKDSSGVVTALGDKNAVVLRLNKLAKEVMDEKDVPYIDGYNLLVNQLSLARGDQYHWNGTAYPQLARLVSDTVGTTRPVGYWGGWGEHEAGDDVVIAAGVKATAVDADFEKINSFKSLTIEKDAELELTISVAATNLCPTTNNGKITKLGVGALYLTRDMGVKGLQNGETVLEDGWTWCPQDFEGWNDFWLGTTTVGSNATLVTSARREGEGMGTRSVNTIVNGLMGWGVITNVTKQNDCQLRCDGARSEPYLFYGTLRPYGLRYYSSGNQWLMNTNNTFMGEFSVHGGYGEYPNGKTHFTVTGIAKLGNYGKTGSGGTASLTSRECGGAFLYLGNGETTTKQYSYYSSMGYPHFFDAGAAGGIRFEGKWSNNSDVNTTGGKVEQVILTGSNAAPCVLANEFVGDGSVCGSTTTPRYTADGTNRITYLTKRGTGTWRFNSNSLRKNCGGIAVEEGTLQFESIAETNAVCSLGLATMLQSAYCGNYDAKKDVSYAYLLGTAKTRGVMEYVGATDASCTTRVFAVQGEGEIRNGAANGIALDLTGFENAPGKDGTLVLGGTNTSGCVVRGTRDAAGGKLGVTKEGTGKWTLAGAHDFSGPLVVKEGTLEVQGAATNRCTWFRFVIRGNAHLHGVSGGDSNLELAGIMFYDENGDPVTTDENMTYLGCSGASNSSVANDWSHMQPGEYGWARGGTYSRYVDNNGFDRDISTLFAHSGANSSICVAWASPVVSLSDSSTWVPIQVRLPEGANDVVAFDVLSRGGGTYCRTISDWTLLASEDGEQWFEVTRYDYDADTMPTSGWHWFSDNSVYTRGTSKSRPNGGYKISPSVTYEENHALRNLTSANVAPGATLKANGHVALPGVTLDCAVGAGAIDGFVLPASGTLNVLNAADGRVTLPNPFVNCVGKENLVKWTLTLDGGSPHGKKVYLRGDDLILAPRGTTLLVR